MNITEAIASEHETFVSLCLQIALLLPGMKSQAEVSTVAGVVEGLLADHARMETKYAFEPLNHAVPSHRGVKTTHREHHEMEPLPV